MGALATVLANASASAQQLPETVYISPLGTAAENVMMGSIAGIANRVTRGEVLISRDNGELRNPRFWLDRLQDAYPQVRSEVKSDPTFFVDRYRALFSGYVLYDRNVNQHSVNMATSIAGVTNAIMVDPSTLHYATAAGLTQVADARNMTYEEVYNQYGSQFNRDKIFHLIPEREEQLRDYAIMNRGFMYYSDPTSLGPYTENQNHQGRLYGWGPSEFELFREASRDNQQVVASDWSWSNSTTARWRIPLAKQATHASPVATAEAGKHYVAFVMSDGDNTQWLTNDFPTNTRWYGSSFRGAFDMTWDLTSTLGEMAPIAFNYLYENASTGEHQDQFISSGGAGLTFPSEYPDIEGLAASMGQSLRDADQRVISILDPSYDREKLGAILDGTDALGLMFKTYSDYYKGRNGAIEFHNGKPIVSVKYSLWDGADSAFSIAESLNSTTHRDPFNDLGSYTIVNVHPWSEAGPFGSGAGDPMANLNQLVDWLDPSVVEVVTLEELMVHLRNNFGSPLELYGDYNDDGIVDAADYTVWRDALATGDTNMANDRTPGAVNASDFDDWVSLYGESSATSSQAVPEPSIAALQVLGLVLLCEAARRRPSERR